MKIALYIDNKGHKDVNLDSLNIGNPGIGGSEYQSYLLAFYLTEFYSEIDCVLFTTNKIKLEKERVKNFIVENILDAVKESKKNKVDILIIIL